MERQLSGPTVIQQKKAPAGTTPTIQGSNNMLIRYWFNSQKMFMIYEQLVKQDDEKPCLSFEQVKKLQIAMSVYKTVPAVIMTPYAYHCIRQAVGTPWRKWLHQLNVASVFKFLTIWLSTYSIALCMRDMCYWPLVHQVYQQVNDKQHKRNYEVYQAMQILEALKIQRDLGHHVQASGIPGYPRQTAGFQNPKLTKIVELSI